MSAPSNSEIAEILERIAELLEAQGANPHRIRAYRNGAQSVRSAREPIARWVQEDNESKLEDLPDIGQGLAGVIWGYVKTGRSSMLDTLQGEVAPEELFAGVPGIGEELAHRIAAELNVRSLEELEQAAHDGRLAQVEGFGRKRVQSVQVALAGMLSRAAQHRVQHPKRDTEQQRPGLRTLLAVDAEYRERAERGDLRKIAPKRFNPAGEAWLPVLETEQDGWQCTALFSNTKRAHELGNTHDWVVIYYERGAQEGQATVVTETHGPLEGKRVVRGREAESRHYYQVRAAGDE